MNDGWYLIKRTGGERDVVEYCQQNTFRSGSAFSLAQRGYTFTEVAIVTKTELKGSLFRLEKEEFETCAGRLENHQDFRWLLSLANL